MKLGRNDKCWCGSGKKYKHCHLGSDNSTPVAKLAAEHQAYINRWARNSGHFTEQNCYGWMAGKLMEYTPSLVFDVGCGSGTGIRELLDTYGDRIQKVISVDENASALRASHDLLMKAGYTVQTFERGNVSASGRDKHQYSFTPMDPSEMTNSKVILVQSDILCDRHFEPFLESVDNIQAVTCWLIGTHQHRHLCSNIQKYGIRSSGEYRLAVQNRVYEMADRILEKNGVLQVVDRGEPPTSNSLRQDLIRAHSEQASVTSLRVVDMDYMVYTEPQGSNSVSMVGTPGLSGRMPDLTELAMISVISRKE